MTMLYGTVQPIVKENEMNKTYLIIGAGVFLLGGALLLGPDEILKLFQALVDAFGGAE